MTMSLVKSTDSANRLRLVEYFGSYLLNVYGSATGCFEIGLHLYGTFVVADTAQLNVTSYLTASNVSDTDLFVRVGA